MLESSKYWFPAKRYGWGWGLPCAWQGWAVLTAYVLVIAGILRFLAPTHRIGLVLLCAAAATAVLCMVCWFKGEPLRWRWGK